MAAKGSPDIRAAYIRRISDTLRPSNLSRWWWTVVTLVKTVPAHPYCARSVAKWWNYARWMDAFRTTTPIPACRKPDRPANRRRAHGADLGLAFDGDADRLGSSPTP